MTNKKTEENHQQKILDESLAYLSGGIDNAKDDGIGWRQEFIQKVKKKRINLTILDPTNKLTETDEYNETGKEKEYHLNLKKNERWDELSAFMKKIVRLDLREVDFCDFLVAKIDTRIHLCGTYHEIIVADFQHKPVLVIAEGGKKNAPSWLYGILDHNLMFNNDDECIEYLDLINKGIVPLDDKWVLLRGKFKGVLNKDANNK